MRRSYIAICEQEKWGGKKKKKSRIDSKTQHATLYNKLTLYKLGNALVFIEDNSQEI